jgi:hypothetical protein
VAIFSDLGAAQLSVPTAKTTANTTGADNW